MNYIAIVRSYKKELDDKFEDGIKMDKNYQNLREKVTENEYENIKTDYMYPMYEKLNC